MEKVDNTYKSIWRIAHPIIIGLVAQNLMVVIDTAFLGRLGEITLGAAAIGGIFYLCLVMLGTGFSVGVQIVIGRRNGEGKFRNIGRIFDHSLYFLLALSLVLFAFVSYLAPSFLHLFLKSESIAAESMVFLGYRRFGFLFGFLILGFNAFYIGTARTNILIWSTALMAILNIVLDYLLIFGIGVFPAMGIAGAAIATNVAEVFTFVFLVIYTWKNPHNRKYRIFLFWKPNGKLYQLLLKVAVPVMFQYFLSFSAWFVFFMILEQIGETALAASNITRSVYMLWMIPVWGLSSATNTLVSNIIGQGRSAEVIPLIKKVLVMGLLITLFFSLVNLALSEHIATLFADEIQVVQATVPLLRVTSLALMAFAFGMIVFSGLSGTGKTMVALKIEILAILIYLTSAFVLATIFRANATAVWFVEVIYFSFLGLLSIIYLRSGKWKVFKL